MLLLKNPQFLPNHYKIWSNYGTHECQCIQISNGEASNFGYFIKNDFYCNSQSFRDCPEGPFNWKLLLIGVVSAKEIRKKVPDLQVGGPV